MKLHFILQSLFICYASASLNHIAFQTAVGLKVYKLVGRECPKFLFKLQHLKGELKRMRKEVASNGIKDLSQFEAELDDSTLENYRAWVCSSESPKQISTFPSIASVKEITGYEGPVDLEEPQAVMAKETDLFSQVDADSYVRDTQTPFSSNYFYVGFFLLGLILGGFAVKSFHTLSTEEKFVNKGNKALRRPEL